jgi:hypothetical protein
MKTSSGLSRLVRSIALGGVLVTALALLAQCASSRRNDSPLPSGSSAAWETVYEVLQHPRCLNCHPVGDVPLQGDESLPHAQNVQGGADGKGLFAMRCATCHQTENAPGPHLPPGAPNWNLPSRDMPLVFEGMSSAELCRQLKDPSRNGHKTPEEILHHVAEDKLVRWGWHPGEGRTPVPVPHEAFVEAMRAWIHGGCDCPE